MLKVVFLRKRKRIIFPIICFLFLFAQNGFGQSEKLKAENLFTEFLSTGDQLLAEELIELNDSTYSLFAKALLSENEEESIELYRQFIEKKPKKGLAEAYFNRGIQFNQLESFKSAISDLNKALRLGIKDPYVYYFKGVAFYGLKKYDDAIENYTLVIKSKVEPYLAHLMRGNVYFDKEEYKKATSDYTKAIELAKKNDQAYLRRGLAYERLNEYKKALADWNEVKQMNGKNIEYVDVCIERVTQKMEEKK